MTQRPTGRLIKVIQFFELVADRLLSMFQCLFRELLLRDVDHGPRAAKDASGGVPLRFAAHHEPSQATVLVKDAVLDFEPRGLTFDVACRRGPYRFRVLRGHQASPVVEMVPDFVLLISENALEHGVHVELVRRELPVPHTSAPRRRCQVAAELAFSQSLARFAAIRDDRTEKQTRYHDDGKKRSQQNETFHGRLAHEGPVAAKCADRCVQRG